LKLFDDLKKKFGEDDSDNTFTASHGWFQKFKIRSKLHNIKVTGETASADLTASMKYLKTLAKIIKDEEYLLQQIVNVDETALFWKKMLDRSYIFQAEIFLPGHKYRKLD
jgi:hypothetical protein